MNYLSLQLHKSEDVQEKVRLLCSVFYFFSYLSRFGSSVPCNLVLLTSNGLKIWRELFNQSHRVTKTKTKANNFQSIENRSSQARSFRDFNKVMIIIINVKPVLCLAWFFFYYFVSQLEGVRIAASKMSPMMETINMVTVYTWLSFIVLQVCMSPTHCSVFVFQCVQYVDSTVLPELVPRLSDLLRTGIGLGTKVPS